MTEDETRHDPELPRDARLSSFDERLREAQAAEEARLGPRERVVRKGQDQGMRILSVLVSYPLGSALIGWAIDALAGTRGIWVAMLFVGFAAAMWEVWKISKQSPQ
ncbi:MAG TPA: AtpZ/AtpI family protein [Allosphingosinicella sp.]|nr:AtpZ/AtpI family protein [Allosphingosinicella sp.]